MKEKIKRNYTYWLRWITVLPGALIFSLLVLFPLHWILYFTLVDGGAISGVNIGPIEYALSPFVSAIVFILAGFKIAPKYKFQASIVLTVLWIAIFIGFFFMSISILQLQFQVRSVGSLLGSFLGLYIAWRQSKHRFNVLI